VFVGAVVFWFSPCTAVTFGFMHAGIWAIYVGRTTMKSKKSVALMLVVGILNSGTVIAV